MERKQENVNFMISPSRGGNLGVKLMYFFKNLLFYPGAWFRQTVYSNDDQGRVYQNCNFHDPGAGVLVLNLGQISCTCMVAGVLELGCGYIFYKSFW